jgi:hypothetical protein
MLRMLTFVLYACPIVRVMHRQGRAENQTEQAYRMRGPEGEIGTGISGKVSLVQGEKK